MTEERTRWSDAFRLQAESDLEVYEVLAARPARQTPRCHALHYLQMVCEKIAKAYRIRDTHAKLHGEGGLLRGHTGFHKFMSSFLHSPTIMAKYSGKTGQLKAVRKRALALAREVEKLAPAVDELISPENAEYPWRWHEDDDVVAPCAHGFPKLSLLHEQSGLTFLKLVRQAVRDFHGIKLP